MSYFDHMAWLHSGHHWWSLRRRILAGDDKLRHFINVTCWVFTVLQYIIYGTYPRLCILILCHHPLRIIVLNLPMSNKIAHWLFEFSSSEIVTQKEWWKLVHLAFRQTGHSADLIMIRWSTHILTIIIRKNDKLNTHSPIYCMKYN